MIILPSLEQETATVLCFDLEEQRALNEAVEQDSIENAEAGEEERGEHHGNGTH